MGVAVHYADLPNLAKLMKKRLPLILALFSMVTAAHAMVTISGVVSEGTAVLSIDQDLTFTITEDGAVTLLIFRDWAEYQDDLLYGGALVDGNLSYSLNNGTDQQTTFQVTSHLGEDWNHVLADDSYLYLDNAISVTAGDTLTFHAGSWALDASANFDPTVTGTFTGSMLLANDNGELLSAVPEPSTYAALAGLLALGFAAVRRRQK